MDESTNKPQWWLIITAAVLAVLTLFYFTGSWLIVVVFFAAVALFVGFRKRRIAKRPAHACLRCGAPLNPNARDCRACGSASWTIRN